jgi:hypothetical protein
VTTHDLELPMWAGYRAGAADTPSSGAVEVSFHGTSPTPPQLAARATADARAASMQDTLLDAIVTAYPTLREWHDRSEAVTKAELKDRVQLYELVVTTQERAGEAYVGYLFACDWDPSGLVVLAHRARVVSVGGFEVLEYPLNDAHAPATADAAKAATPAGRVHGKARARKR